MIPLPADLRCCRNCNLAVDREGGEDATRPPCRTPPRDKQRALGDSWVCERWVDGRRKYEARTDRTVKRFEGALP